MATAHATISNVAWTAILKRDRLHDERFVYAALTTGIYCRPSCPARHPLRRNVLLFATAGEAEREGFIACRRCRPENNSLTPAESSTKTALEWIETHARQPTTLCTLSRVTGLSPNYLQQLFKRIVGLSPKQFCDARRLDYFKHYIRQGASLCGASNRAGYGSSRALYERAGRGLGMTPGTYARGGRGARIEYALFAAKLGRTLIAATDHGVCAVISGDRDTLLLEQLRSDFPQAVLRLKASPGKWSAAVSSSQADDRLLAWLSLDLRRRIFQARVWKALQ
jgi:AraC family transcriptional regulator of adaptative response/methylated-DNA-[protein]-cysteine methyltransferase